MKNKLLPILALVLAACGNESFEPENESEGLEPIEIAEPVKPMSKLIMSESQINAVEGYNAFGWNIFIVVSDKDAAANHVVSPVSINSALSILGEMTDGENGQKISAALGMTDVEEMSDLNEKLIKYLPYTDKDTELSLANAVWLADRYTPSQSMVKTIGKKYGATVRSVDFRDSRVVDLINGWVNEYTRGCIPEIISKIDPLTELSVTNAMYFNGKWQMPFNAERTMPGEFQNTDGQVVRVRNMNMCEELAFAEDNFACMTSLPFDDGKFCMDIILPAENHHLTYEEYSSLCASCSTDSVVLILPRFEFEADYGNIAEITHVLGIPCSNYTFTGLGIPETNEISLSNIIHKTYISVGEYGAEAAAATHIGMQIADLSEDEEKTVHEYKYVICDRPFNFVIREREHNIVLLVGKVNSLPDTPRR
ncbi:MAG: hypothetical protein K2M19_02975 [Muribaculaceae bacterium]|nr:hypothetical protein [Muribaculaceae bacterium]